MTTQYEAIVARMEADHPGWKVWYVPLALGGMTWCAQRWEGPSPVLNAPTADVLAELIEQQDYPQRPMDTSDIDPETGES